MRVLWEYPLQIEEGSSGYRYEGPIHVQGDWLYYVTCHPWLYLHILNYEDHYETRFCYFPFRK